MGMVESRCIECGGKTLVKKSHAAKGCGKFCSRKCTAIYRGKVRSAEKDSLRVHRVCATCGGDIYLKKSHAERGFGVYCSRKCMSEGYKERLLGDENPNWRGGISSVQGHYQNQRRCADGYYTQDDVIRIGELQRWRCANCRKKVANKYHIDHIMPIALGGNNWPFNLQILCPHCNHRKHASDPISWANANGRLI